MGMKKRIAAVLMGFMLIGSVSEAVYGAESLIPIETVVTEVTEIEKESEVSEDTDESIAAEQQESEIVEESADISAEILQEGGLLKHEDISTFEKVEGYQTFSLDTATYDKVEEAVLEALDNFSERCNLSAYNIPTSQIGSVFGEILNTNPRYFYVSGRYGYNYNTSTGMVHELIIGYTYTKEQAAPMLEKYDAAINTALSGISPSWSVMEKTLYLNDYLACSCAYDTTFAADHIYSSYGALVNKVAVCQGYALAYLELANALGIPCEVVTSDSLNHAWNMIQLNGNYYQLDVTWNDPIYDLLGYAGHQFFLKSTNYFKSAEGEHLAAADWEVTGGWQESYAADTSYDAAIWNHCDRGFDYINGYWYSFDQMSDCITRYSCNGTNMTEVADVMAVNDYWYKWGDTCYTVDSYVGTGAFGGKYYYSTTNSIYELNLDTMTTSCIYTLPEEQKEVGYIYGMVVEPSGALKYYLAKQRDNTGAVYQAATLTKTETASNTYQVAFASNGGTGNTMSNLSGCKANQYYKLPKCTYKRAGYKFIGWNTNADGSGTAYADNAAIVNLTNQNGGTVTLYAQWKLKEYTITYVLSGGKNHKSNPATYNVNSEFTLKEPTHEEYIFGGWFTDTSFTNEVTKINKGTTGNLVLYAGWLQSTNYYNIKFNGNGHTSGSTKGMSDCLYGKEYTLTANGFKKKGYTFDGWNTKKDGSGTSYKDKASVKNLTQVNDATVTLYAQWKKTKYKITYNLDGGTNSSKNPSKYYITTSTITLKNPSKKGYSFKGWYSDKKFKNKVTKIKKGSTGDVTLYAKWSANKYTIKFNGNGSTSGKMKNMTSCKYGTSYQLTKNSYKKKGYTFAGWNTKKDGSGKSYDNKEKVKKLTSKNGGNVTLYAQWKKTKYTISYNLKGGKNNSKNPSKYYVTTSTIKLKNPTKKGYKFVGWYSDSKYKKKVTQIKKGSTGNIKLYAKWKKK